MRQSSNYLIDKESLTIRIIASLYGEEICVYVLHFRYILMDSHTRPSSLIFEEHHPWSTLSLYLYTCDEKWMSLKMLNLFSSSLKALHFDSNMYVATLSTCFSRLCMHVPRLWLARMLMLKYLKYLINLVISTI